MKDPLTSRIREATVEDVESVAPLFDAYRQFYGKDRDLELARSFLAERLKENQSTIFLAFSVEGPLLGFTQLFPSFSSVEAGRTYILNDLFVVPKARRLGVGGKLLEVAADYCRSKGAVRLSLSTALGNETAQSLYLSKGWERDARFCVFHLRLFDRERRDQYGSMA